jgi:hypothetical protein
MALDPDLVLRAGDVVSVEGTVRWPDRGESDVGVDFAGSTTFVPREALTLLSTRIQVGDFVRPRQPLGREAPPSGEVLFLLPDGRKALVLWAVGESVEPLADLLRVAADRFGPLVGPGRVSQSAADPLPEDAP